MVSATRRAPGHGCRSQGVRRPTELPLCWPLADPEILARIPGWILQRDAPVRFKPRFDPDQWQWILRFLQACNGSDKLRSVAALLPLSLYSQRLIHDLVHEDGFEFDYRQNGKLIIHRQRRSFEAARALRQKHRELSDSEQALDRYT